MSKPDCRVCGHPFELHSLTGQPFCGSVHYSKFCKCTGYAPLIESCQLCQKPLADDDEFVCAACRILCKAALAGPRLDALREALGWKDGTFEECIEEVKQRSVSLNRFVQMAIELNAKLKEKDK